MQVHQKQTLSNHLRKEAPFADINFPAAEGLIKSYEGLNLTAYKCPSGRWTIGYGATYHPDNNEPVMPGEKITKEKAQEYLNKHIDRVLEGFQGSFSKNSSLRAGFNKLSANAKAALVSFGFNLGENFLGKTGFETITEAVRSGSNSKVASAMMLYTNNGLPGLVSRRKDEADLAQKKECSKTDIRQNDAKRPLGTMAYLNGRVVFWAGLEERWVTKDVFKAKSPENFGQQIMKTLTGRR